jgi:hypothetical protein
VLITAVEDRPAAFGFVAAIEFGIARDVAIARVSSIEILLRFIERS